jgi:hypothetical protein
VSSRPSLQSRVRILPLSPSVAVPPRVVLCAMHLSCGDSHTIVFMWTYRIPTRDNTVHQQPLEIILYNRKRGGRGGAVTVSSPTVHQQRRPTGRRATTHVRPSIACSGPSCYAASGPSACLKSSYRVIGPLLPGGGANLRTFAMLGGGLTPLAKSSPLYGGGVVGCP